mmetsp:Transcript_12364/g.35357  ORF Transcript_12364/g.35357 Transcript_12364/m.35357 type:complete len:960 (+) Transcript_12364:93-2972(+)
MAPSAIIIGVVSFALVVAGASALVASSRPANKNEAASPASSATSDHYASQPNAASAGSHALSIPVAEPSALAKLTRRARVFTLAGKVFLSYKSTERKEKRLRKDLGLSTDDGDDPTNSNSEHPDVLALWDRAHENNAARILSKIERLQGFWIKVGQYLSSRADVMPIQYLHTLAKLQDGVPAKPYEEVHKTLLESFTTDQMAMFEHIDPSPLSTASLAQVHRAKLVDGRDVVVKVQHRGVASLMRQDMTNLRTILNILARSDPNLDFNPVVNEYTAEVVRELDFRTECANMEEVRELLATSDVRAKVPQSIPELVTERVLTMDFCEGFPIRDLAKLDENHVDRPILLSRVCEAWAMQMHVGGTFNADPHSGNILVSTAETDGDASVPVLLDFGLTKRLDDNMRLAFARLVHAADENDVDALLQSFKDMGLVLNRYDPFEDMAGMRRSFADPVPQSQAKESLKEKARDRKLREKAMKDEQGVDERGKLRNPVDAWPSELVFFTRVTAMLRGLCSRLEVQYPYLNTMAKSARTALKDSVPHHERAQSLVHVSADDHTSSLQERVRKIAEGIVKEEQAVGLQFCVICHGDIVANVAAGTLGTADPRPVVPSSLFNAFSVSKAVLAAGALILIQEKGIDVDDPISLYWPEFASHPEKECITIRQALSHQAGLADAFPKGASIDVLTDWEEMKNFIASPEALPSHSPGDETRYHYLSFAWIIGGLIESITKEPYERYLEKYVIDPSGVQEDMFMAGIAEEIGADRLAILTMKKPANTASPAPGRKNANEESQKKRKVVLEKFRGQEQMLNPSIFNMRKIRNAKLPSANGHFSAAALAKVFNTLMVGDTNTPPLLESKTIDAARSPQASASSAKPSSSSPMLDNQMASFGLGFQIHEIRSKDDGRTMRSLGHAGLGGSILLCIPELGLSIAFTTNTLSPRSVARDGLIEAVLDEFGLIAPKSLID